MAEQGINKINNLRRRYIAYRMLADVLWAFAASVFAAGILCCFFDTAILWSAILFVLTATVLFLIHRHWLITNQQIAGFLDQQYPELEESTGLVLQPIAGLNILQQFAAVKTSHVLHNLNVGHGYFARRLVWPAVALVVAVVFTVAMSRIPHHAGSVRWGVRSGQADPIARPEVVLPQIDEAELTIIPPAYTGRGKRSQDKFNLLVEDGAIVQWYIRTNIAVKEVSLLFNDNRRMSLTNNNAHTEWRAQRAINKAGFYQVIIDGKLSDFYQVQVTKDAPPVIHIKTPKQYTYIDAGEAQKVNVSAALTDDYGINNALIMATVAKGRGEGVKFKEHKLNFNTAFTGQAKYDVQKLIDLPALNMEPGDELYFYVLAQDTHQQQSRTDVFTVAIQDTAELLSMDGVLSAANLKPEFFRSQRQIIIDAEQLIKDKDSISIEKFNNRANELGIDQKLLRLRYGKFLGEEDEVTEGPKGSDEPARPEDFSNAAKILKEYTDGHDKAEDAQFFEPAIKAQLKATLAEMWKSELQLRLYQPKAALPFAYKALRLLKDLQQKSRSYVAKTSYNPPPLKLDKRLSGELDKIIQPVDKQEIKAPADKQAVLKNAVAVLEDLKTNPALNAGARRSLQLANQRLGEIASAQPGAYLPSLSAMRRLLSAQKLSLKDINTVQRAIQKSLLPLKTEPATDNGRADLGLSRRYFKNLKTNNR